MWKLGASSNMTAYEIHQMITEYMNNLHQLTEFWLTISFAVVVAATYAPRTLERRFFTLIWIGYLSASVIFLLNRISITYMASALIQNSEVENASLPQFHPFFATAGAAGIYLLMVIGTAGVIYYVRNIGKKHAASDT